MTRRHRRALVVGKFSPLHLGHEYVLETAGSRCDELLILSYARPERAGCGRERRERWLCARFPNARVLVVDAETLASIEGAPPLPEDTAEDQVHRRFVGHLCLHGFGCTVDAVYTSEAYGPGFAAELTHYFAEHGMPQEVEHVMVDRERTRVPISATRIMEDVHAHRAYLSDEVYSSFVEKVAVLGGESSGKSTLCSALARHFESLHVEEFGRTLWEERRGELGFADMLAIAKRQVELEDAACRRATRYLFCDTTPLVTRFYSEELFGEIAPELARLATRRYEFTVLCAPDFAFQQDGTRRDAAFRERQHQYYVDALEAAGSPYVLLTGSVAERVRRTEQALAALAASNRARSGVAPLREFA